MLTSQAQTKSHCHKKAEVHPGVHRLQDAGGSQHGTKTTLGLLLGRGAPASVHPGEVVGSPSPVAVTERFDEHLSGMEKHNPG